MTRGLGKGQARQEPLILIHYRGGNGMVGKVGFIGLGNMGGPMALNLVKHGFSLVVHDIDAAKLEPLVAAGAAVEHSPAAVAALVERTICMVETTDQAEEVIT